MFCARRAFVTLVLVVMMCGAAVQCCAFTRPTSFTSKTAKTCAAFLVNEKISRLKASPSQVTPPSAPSAFLHHHPPYMAIITEPDACDSPERMIATLQTISSAVSTDKVALVSVRVVQPNHIARDEFEERVVNLTTQLVAMSSEHSFRVVVASDWVEAAIQSRAHGVHVKEHHQSRIPEIRKQFAPRDALIGTSAHSVKSALEARSLYQPDYFFVGTCYPTESHPEKVELEGPILPGKVCRALEGQEGDRPIILAIGGIDEENCADLVLEYGADGVAAIRSVFQSPDPASSVESMIRNMRQTGD